MNYRNLYRTLLVGVFVVTCSAQTALCGPVYEPITGFRQAALSPGGSLFRHSDGTFYGMDVIGLLYRITPDGEVSTFPPILGARFLDPRDLFEAGDGSIWASRRQDEQFRGPNVFRLDQQREKAITMSPLPTAMSWATGSRLVSDGLGFLWGMTWGESVTQRVIYKIKENTGELSVIAYFEDRAPVEALILDPHGNLWGTIDRSKASDASLFVVNAKTGAYRELHFPNIIRDIFGAGPLSLDEAGNLWCRTVSGHVLKVNTATLARSVVAEFDTSTDPNAREVNTPTPGKLESDRNGNMWGTTFSGSLGGGSIFKVNIETGTMTVIAEYEGRGSIGLGELANDGAGHLWTTAQSAVGLWLGGSILKVDIATSTLATSMDLGDALKLRPSRALVPDDAGNMWGTTSSDSSIGGSVFKVNRETNEVKVITDFERPPDSEAEPAPGTVLVTGGDGSLWGIIDRGYFNEDSLIYKLDPVTFKMTRVVQLRTFGKLAADPAGDLWGVGRRISADLTTRTSYLFKIDAHTGELTPMADLSTQAVAIRGLDYDGVDSFWGTLGDRRLFRVNATTAAVTVFESINPANIEDDEDDPLVSDGVAHLWGIYRSHEKFVDDYIFKVNTHTAEVTTVVTFNGVERFPTGLCSDGRGHLWGTVGIGPRGRTPDLGLQQPGFGAVFKLNAPTGKLTYLYDFLSLSYRPFGVIASALAFDGEDTFYGTIGNGGARRLGTIASFTRSSFTPVFDFTGVKGPVPGAFPWSSRGRKEPPLVRHSDGNFYGSTFEGGMLPDGRPGGAGQWYRIRFGPTPVTLPTVQSSPTAATLRGTVNPNGAATTVRFEYGNDPELKTFWTVSAGQVPALTRAKPVSAQVDGLEPNQTYYFRVVAQNAENAQPQRGALLSFTAGASSN